VGSAAVYLKYTTVVQLVTCCPHFALLIILISPDIIGAIKTWKAGLLMGGAGRGEDGKHAVVWWEELQYR